MSARHNSVASNAATRTANAQPTQRDGSEYFDLHTRGCGYLSRVRWVETTSRGRKSEPFLCCAINALHGDVNAPSYTYFDLRVTGGDAQQLIASLEQYVVQKKKVFLAFSIGDIYAHPYERTTFDKDRKPVGKEQSALIKGRLLQVTHARVDDVVIYSATGVQAADTDDTAADTPDGQVVETAEPASEVDVSRGSFTPRSHAPYDLDEDGIF